MDECSNLIYDETGGQVDMGQSDSKGARKRSTTPSGRGAAMSFGFRKRSGGSKVGTTTASTGTNLADKNGNGGSTEELYTGSPVLSGRSTPLARPRKESSGQPLRTNRFGFRQSTIPKTAKVADINISAEQALSANQENKNNNINDKNSAKSAYNAPIGLIPTQVGPTGLANINSQARPTKQTVILTYSAKQHPVVPNNGLRSKSPAVPGRVTNYPNYNNQRSVSASRAYSGTTYNNDQVGSRFGNVGKYTFQTNQLPKPQYPAVKVLDTKSAKQVANNSRKVYGSSDGSSKEGSVTEDSGVSGLGDNGLCGDRGDSAWSPQPSRRQHRRPRTLEMIMQGDHNFHLREMQVNDLEIMVNDVLDEAIVTDIDVIPLPKLPSTFDNQKEEYFQVPENRFTNIQSRKASVPTTDNQETRSYLATLERYRTNRDRDRSLSDAEDVYKYKGEEKASRDRIQHEKGEKQDFAKMTSSQQNHMPLTRDSSKESSPSTKSEESHPSTVSSTGSDPLEAWVNQTAGESMAMRSQDDISAALSLSSSCDDDKGYNKSTNMPSFTPTTVTILNKEPAEYASLTTHPMMLKSLSLSQHHGLQSMFMSSSMASSAFSSDSSSFIGNELRNLGLMLGETNRLGMAALNTSNHSLIEDETSPADSLISSSTDSNNDMPILEKDVTVSTSAYHTADNRTVDVNKDDCMEDNMKDKESNEKSPSKKSPYSPDTPTNASNSLSLSEGRDFLIDDEIADQPALIFEANSTADQATSSLQLLNINNTDNTPTLLDTTNFSIANKSKGQKANNSPLRPKKSPSLDTLSPCDSIASDDLMMDMELNNSITSLNSVDEYIDRLDGSIRSGLNSLEDTQLREELLKLSIRKYSSQILNHDAIGGTPSKHQGQSNSTSNSSLANMGATLPVRTGRLLTRSRTGTPDSPLVQDGSRGSSATAASAPGGTPDDALRLERATHGSMLHDIVTIKTMLLKLKRVLQEPDEEHNLMRTETLNPLDNQRDICPLKNGPSLRLGDVGEASPPPPPPAPHEEVADLRRQLVFLQSQLEERERMVKLLQQQMSKYNDTNSGAEHAKCNGAGNNSNEDTCNVATQTERLRPSAQGSNILQSLNSDSSHHAGSIVSWNEQSRGRNILSPCNPRQSSSSPTSPLKRPVFSLVNSPVNSDCETVFDNNVKSVVNVRSKSNLHKRDIPSRLSVMDSPVQIKTNCRVGSKYLQAIANRQNNNNYFNNEVNSDERTSKSTSLHTRSKSIENFGNHHLHQMKIDRNDDYNDAYYANEKSERLNGKEGKAKHHTSYTNLYNGTMNGDNDCNHPKTNGHHKKNGYTNGNATDTDDNSDSVYKSLPPSINLLTQSKISSIPRRTLTSELRTPSKYAQTNKC